MKLVQVAIAFYLISILVWTQWANFGTRQWEVAYFLCADIGAAGWLLWLLVYKTIGKPYKAQVLPVLVLSILIFLWDAVSYKFNIGVNHPKAVFWGFLIADLTIAAVVIIMEVQRRWRK